MSEKGKHFDEGKAPIHLIPEEAIIGMAKAFGYGAKKYDRFNFRKGIDYTRITDSLMRHTLQFLRREDLDQESGLPHLYHAAANIAMLIYMSENRQECDDRYQEPQKEVTDVTTTEVQEAKPQRGNPFIRDPRK